MKDETAPDSAAPTIRERLIQLLVQPVPANLAVCEFSCSANECSHEEWQRCSRRKLAAGERGEETPTLP